MQFVFGIDGGGTSARLRIESLGGDRLFYAEGGSTNPNSNSWESVNAVLKTLFDKAYREASLRPQDCAAGFAGSAGIDRPADREPFETALRAAAALSGTCAVGVGNDAEPALAGAIGDIEGLLLIAGTGSIAYGRSHDGLAVRAGGLGHLLGDEGSGFRVGFDAIVRSLRSIEGRDLPTKLMDEALAYFGLKEPADFVTYIYSKPIDKTFIGGFTPIVADCRDRGDPLALDIFDQAARELESLVLSVDHRLAGHIQNERLALRGGSIEHDAVLRAALTGKLAASAPQITIVPAKADAATGACILARSLLSH